MHLFELFEDVGNFDTFYDLKLKFGCWINPSSKQFVRLPSGEHHTTFVVHNPEIFNFNLGGYIHRLENEGMTAPPAYDDEVIREAGQNGWVRVGIEPPMIVAEGCDLKAIWKAILQYQEYLRNQGIQPVGIVIEHYTNTGRKTYDLTGKREKVFLQSGRIGSAISSFFSESLNEEAIDINTYGAWVTPEGKVHHVPPQGHPEFAKQFFNNGNHYKAYRIAFDAGWVRTTHERDGIGIQGQKTAVQKAWKWINRTVMQMDRVVVDTVKPGQYQPAHTYIFHLPDQRAKLIQFMTQA
jgi:hypothetical protein